eukprot:TRINITY_DN2613_c0_g1_i1.p1 TRINITY_DN2613_c0_g1~~TRINITY_DN2613_c0_g1_i1.p1  ORF type:complete len:279 (-),score=60.02 TRINITY_DN2613_c0_g1_i1:93-929(-)
MKSLALEMFYNLFLSPVFILNLYTFFDFTILNSKDNNSNSQNNNNNNNNTNATTTSSSSSNSNQNAQNSNTQNLNSSSSSSSSPVVSRDVYSSPQIGGTTGGNNNNNPNQILPQHKLLNLILDSVSRLSDKIHVLNPKLKLTCPAISPPHLITDSLHLTDPPSFLSLNPQYFLILTILNQTLTLIHSCCKSSESSFYSLIARSMMQSLWTSILPIVQMVLTIANDSVILQNILKLTFNSIFCCSVCNLPGPRDAFLIILFKTCLSFYSANYFYLMNFL